MAAKNVGCAQKQSFVLEFLKFTSTMEAHEQFADEFASMKPMMDASLAKLYANLKQKGTTEIVFLKAHELQCKVIMDPADFDAVMAASQDQDFTTVAPQLNRLMHASKTGASVFTFAAKIVDSMSFKKHVEGALVKVKAANFSEDAINEFKTVCRAKSISIRGVKNSKRKVNMAVLGDEAMILVTDPMAEAELRLAALLKSETIGTTDGLAPLPHEKLTHDFDSNRKCTAHWGKVEPLEEQTKIT